MPTIPINGADIHYTETGTGPETIVFAHGLLMSGEMFAAQIAALAPRYRCVAYDHRGQGRSSAPKGGYGMNALANDAIAIVEKLGRGPVHFAGLSMGGFVGMRVAARRPDLVRSLMLLDTSAEPEPKEKVGRYKLMIAVAKRFGLRLLAGRVMPILFGRTFLRDPARAAERKRWRDHLAALDRESTPRAVAGILDRAGVEHEIGAIRVPTLVLVGAEDVATVPAEAERIAARIAGATLVVVPRAGHSAPIEEPAAVTAALEAFLARVPR